MPKSATGGGGIECNEDMGTGMLLARFEYENDPIQTVAMCTCHYNNLLMGHAYKHRTYEAKVFEEARAVCKELALFDALDVHRDGVFPNAFLVLSLT